MTSFPSQARRVRDRELPPVRRLHALRECALHFAPYGFRATWHHLVVSARIPRRLEDDPVSLERAVDELSEGRDVMLAVRLAYEQERRLEKASGRRVPRSWNPPDGYAIAYCPDPERHPTASLATVVRRILGAGAGSDGRCVACGTVNSRPGWACAVCGVQPGGPRTCHAGPDADARWARIWRR
ncbi:hypothetical protein [Winogradskya humida]|uniref:TniQ protein n=1 Tax=Winogradskya humida TaxID=113566 RepID=A0ABQ3ZJA7_9ACTN|nr:hypothetical protein [Actinoplanes humidus]GIE18670.1 hypothetical protein Ahu01nite_017720 [Actinoplanes humidus]